MISLHNSASISQANAMSYLEQRQEVQWKLQSHHRSSSNNPQTSGLRAGTSPSPPPAMLAPSFSLPQLQR